jgi:alanyl-tRNA synthetase
MVQFKDVFTGKKTLPYKRATTSQKCLRAGGKHNDLENVGYTARHHTFFEMLGNFSFGDYFKDGAIDYAWKFVINELGLPLDRLFITVHSSDNEAPSIWRKVSGLPDDRIIRIPTSDNFWAMGNTGPCGPCSEIFFDKGEHIQGGLPGSANQDGDRFIEIWNLVFMEFEMLDDGTRIRLPNPSIDTGMGIERIASILQGVDSNYEIDLFKSIIADVKNVTSCDSSEFTAHNNVVADHIRAITFMIADGVVPSNEGRGYVLRRIIRRAMRHGYAVGVRDPFLYRLVQSVVNVMGDHYKEIGRDINIIQSVVKNEEEMFMRTIDNGMNILERELEKVASVREFPAEIAYKLCDTYGFPLDLTQDILKSHGKVVDQDKFDEIVKRQRAEAKKAWTGSGDAATEKIWFDISSEFAETEFVRQTKEIESNVVAIVKGSERVDIAGAIDDVSVITDRTVFYAESGGQAGDGGTIVCDNCELSVNDTKIVSGIIIHKCSILSGQLRVGDKALLKLDWKKRMGSSRNHTATHILQKALGIVLGAHVAQKGSLVTESRLRFDFMHNSSIDADQVARVEEIVTDAIDECLEVSTKIMHIDEARSSGATALFGEKYPDEVRVVTIGDDFSKELCGGEHVSNTSQIGCFKIVSVTSVGAGIKRIEAVTGRGLAKYFESKVSELDEKIAAQSEMIKELRKKTSELKSNNFVKNTVIKSDAVGKVTLRYVLVEDLDQKSVFGLVDEEKRFDDERMLLVGNLNKKSDRLSVSLFASSKVISRGFDGKKILSLIGSEITHSDFKAGGRTDLAQAGCFISDNFEDCLRLLKKYISDHLY